MVLNHQPECVYQRVAIANPPCLIPQWYHRRTSREAGPCRSILHHLPEVSGWYLLQNTMVSGFLMVSGVWGIVGRDYSCRSMAIINDPCSEHTEEWNSWRVCLGWTGWTFWTSSIPNTNGKSSCSPLRPFGGVWFRSAPCRSRSSVIAVFSQFFQHRSKDFLFNLCQHLVCANMLATCQAGPPNYSSNHRVYTCLHHYDFFFVWVCVDTEHYFCMFNGFQAQHGVLVKLLTAMVGCVSQILRRTRPWGGS